MNCPVCKGWGFKQLPLKNDTEVCSFCHGKPAQVVNENFYLSWDIPAYIDFGRRKSNRVKVLVLFAVMAILTLLFVLFMIYVFQTL